MRIWEAEGLEQGWDQRTGRGPPHSPVASLYDQGRRVFSQKGGREEEEEDGGGGTNKIKGHCCLFESRGKCPALCGGRAPWKGGSPGRTRPPAPRDPVGVDKRGQGGRWWRKPAGASRTHWLLCACAPLCVPGVAPVVVVPIVRRPLALVLIVLVPLLGILGREKPRAPGCRSSRPTSGFSPDATLTHGGDGYGDDSQHIGLTEKSRYLGRISE